MSGRGRLGLPTGFNAWLQMETETPVRENLSSYHPTAGGCFLSFPFLYNYEERNFIPAHITDQECDLEPAVRSWGLFCCTGDICQCLETFIFLHYILRSYLISKSVSICLPPPVSLHPSLWQPAVCSVSVSVTLLDPLCK